VNEFRVTFARSASKELAKLDRPIVERIFPTIDPIANEPRPHGCRKLAGSGDR
jgi:mRNA interferase RelE/StbE